MMRQQAESPVIILFSIFLFLILFTFYIFSLNPVLPTGDAGGLITASHFLGTAHPPGYPLYVELGKILTFLPVGNIGFRVSLLPCLFSVNTLLILYFLMRELISGQARSFSHSEDANVSEKSNCSWKNLIPTLAVLALGVSYSFYFQTIIGKFYPINAFMVIVLVILGVTVLKNGFDTRYIYLSVFILGLSTGLHHTALFMSVPLLIVGLFHFRSFLKTLPLSVVFFFIGFAINLHIYIRNIKDVFYAARKEGFPTDFFDILLRKFYKEGESIQAVTSAISTFDGFVNSIKNFFYMIDANFGYVTLIFFILGLIYLFKFNRKIFSILFVSFIMFSFVLAKITFSADIEGNEGALYIIGNQYFIPAFCLYVIFFVSGIYFFVDKIKKFRLISYILPIFFIFIYLTLIPMRYSQTGQSNNWMLYYYSKDLLSTMPVSAVLNTYGDNKGFGTWYMKLVGRYRDDVCHTVVFRYESTDWNMDGCKPKGLYSKTFLEIYKKEIALPLARRRYYSTIGLSQVHPLFNLVDTKPYALSYIYFLKGKISGEDHKFVSKINIRADKFITSEYCLNHGTDDPLTFSLCKFVGVAYLNIASSIIPKNQTGIYQLDTTIRYGNIHEPYKVNIILGKENEDYVDIYERIGKYNDRRKAYLLP